MFGTLILQIQFSQSSWLTVYKEQVGVTWIENFKFLRGNLFGTISFKRGTFSLNNYDSSINL